MVGNLSAHQILGPDEHFVLVNSPLSFSVKGSTSGV